MDHSWSVTEPSTHYDLHSGPLSLNPKEMRRVFKGLEQ